MEQEYAKTTSKKAINWSRPTASSFCSREGGTYHALFGGDGGVVLSDAVIL